jgi:hypothetical protein
LLWLFWRWGLLNSMPRLALNLYPPDLNLPIARITSVSRQCLTFSLVFPIRVY